MSSNTHTHTHTKGRTIHTFHLFKMLLFERRRMGHGTGRHDAVVLGKQAAHKRRAKAVCRAGVPGLALGAEAGFDGGGPCGDGFGGKGKVLVAPGGEVEALGQRIGLGLAVFGDGVLHVEGYQRGRRSDEIDEQVPYNANKEDAHAESNPCPGSETRRRQSRP